MKTEIGPQNLNANADNITFSAVVMTVNYGKDTLYLI